MGDVAGFETYTIYEKPKDFPTSFVVRRWTVGPGVLDPQPDPAPLLIAPTLATARAALALHVPGLSCLPRDPTDDSVIVETWI